MSETLPLFDDLEPTSASAGPVRSRGSSLTGRVSGQRADASSPSSAARAAGPTGPDRHLRAAWRLSRAMWRFPDHSPQQTRAGLAICEHLQALLAEAEPKAPRPKSDPPESRAGG